MSIRTDHNSTDASYAGAVRKDLETLKQTAVEAARLDAVDQTFRPTSEEAAAAYDSLAPVEQSAANLGVEPGALRPIGFMNAGLQINDLNLAMSFLLHLIYPASPRSSLRLSEALECPVR